MLNLGPAARSFAEAVLHSYSLIFFSQHLGFAVLLLVASLLNPYAGAAGLLAAGLAVGFSRLLGFNRELTQLGTYSFNALLVGWALGSFYAPSLAFWGVLLLGALLTQLVSVTMSGWLARYGLPILSLPAVLVLWLLVPTADRFYHLGLSEAGLYWLNDLYAVGGQPLVDLMQHVRDWPVPPALLLFLRALSAVMFQDNVLIGLLVAIGLLWHSRISFSLLVLAYVGVWAWAHLAGVPFESIPHYDLSANYFMTTLAVGAVFVIPSRASYVAALVSIPVTGFFLTGLSTLVAPASLPLYSLPFAVVALLYLYALLLRTRPGLLQLTPVQLYSPETNLYRFVINRKRLRHELHLRLSLPFLGEWTVTQGYDGELTHLGEWGQALDFMIVDTDGGTYRGAGLSLADYYCYNKPVLAPADGVVEEVIQHLDDNPIGQVNTQDNWGNVVVMRHADGLYSKLAHLRPQSVPVRVGERVRRGEVVGYCGNSGRSAEPHLHFQLQATPYVGSRSLAYPLAEYLTHAAAAPRLHTFDVPAKGQRVSNPTHNPLLQAALAFPPGYRLRVQLDDHSGAPAQDWEVRTDAYNQRYFRCLHTGAVAYFERTEDTFYFTGYYGPVQAWLYLFYRAAYRVSLTYLPEQGISDALPLTELTGLPLRWLQDVLAPFYLFLKPAFELHYAYSDHPYHPRRLHLRSQVAVRTAGRGHTHQQSLLELQDGALAAMTIELPDQTLRLLCAPVVA